MKQEDKPNKDKPNKGKTFKSFVSGIFSSLRHRLTGHYTRVSEKNSSGQASGGASGGDSDRASNSASDSAANEYVVNVADNVSAHILPSYDGAENLENLSKSFNYKVDAQKYYDANLANKDQTTANKLPQLKPKPNSNFNAELGTDSELISDAKLNANPELSGKQQLGGIRKFGKRSPIMANTYNKNPDHPNQDFNMASAPLAPIAFNISAGATITPKTKTDNLQTEKLPIKPLSGREKLISQPSNNNASANYKPAENASQGKLSEMEGVTFFLTPVSHEDMLPEVIMSDFLRESVSQDEGLKTKTAIFVEDNSNSVARNPREALFSNKYIRDWKSKKVRPSTPRASFNTEFKRLKEVENDIMSLTGVEVRADGSYGLVKESEPDIDIVGADNKAACEEYMRAEASFAAKGMLKSSEWIKKRAALIEQRNVLIAKNIAQYIKRRGVSLGAGAFGTLHETEPNCKPLSKCIKEELEKLGIKCNVVVVPVSRDKLPIVEQDTEFYDRLYNNSVSDDGLRRISFGPTNIETANCIFVPDSKISGSHGDKIFSHVMQIISRQEELKKPEDRRSYNEQSMALASRFTLANKAKPYTTKPAATKPEDGSNAWAQNFERRKIANRANRGIQKNGQTSPIYAM